jgi:hypothetical protein
MFELQSRGLNEQNDPDRAQHAGWMRNRPDDSFFERHFRLGHHWIASEDGLSGKNESVARHPAPRTDTNIRLSELGMPFGCRRCLTFSFSLGFVN